MRFKKTEGLWALGVCCSSPKMFFACDVYLSLVTGNFSNFRDFLKPLVSREICLKRADLSVSAVTFCIKLLVKHPKYP